MSDPTDDAAPRRDDTDPDESTAASPDGGGEQPPEESAAERAARRQRLAAVFGDDLPDQTRDDLDVGDDPVETVARDEWIRGQVPPHHG